MKLSDRFRVRYWIGAFGVLTLYVLVRVIAMAWSGTEPTKPDLLFGALWAVFALVPIFSVIKVGGVSVEQHDNHVTADQYRTPQEINSLSRALDAPADRLMPDEPPAEAAPEPMSDTVLESASTSDESLRVETITINHRKPDDRVLFRVVQRKVNRVLVELATVHEIELPRLSTTNQKITSLAAAGCIPEDLVTPLRVLYDVCIKGLRRESLTDSQIEFVRAEQKRIIGALRALAG